MILNEKALNEIKKAFESIIYGKITFHVCPEEESDYLKYTIEHNHRAKVFENKEKGIDN